MSHVYGFVEAGGSVELSIHRLPGGSEGSDKFVVQWAEVPPEEENPQAPFAAQAQSGEMAFTVEAKQQQQQ